MGYGISTYDSASNLTLSIDDSKLLILHTQLVVPNTGSGSVPIPTLDPTYAYAMVVPLGFQRMAKVAIVNIYLGSFSWTAPTGPYAVNSRVIIVSK